jgi:protease I
MKKIFFIFSLILLSGCSLKPGQPVKNMSEVKKNILMVIAPINFRDVEYFTPKKIFEDAGFSVSTASIQSGTARGADGGEAKIDLTVGQANPADYAAVVFAGGPGMAQITGDESLQTLAIKSVKAGKLIAAICVAPAVLARAGLLTGVEATSHADAKQDLEDYGAIFKDQSVVAADKIITANGPEASTEFADQIIEKINTAK